MESSRRVTQHKMGEGRQEFSRRNSGKKCCIKSRRFSTRNCKKYNLFSCFPVRIKQIFDLKVGLPFEFNSANSSFLRKITRIEKQTAYHS